MYIRGVIETLRIYHDVILDLKEKRRIAIANDNPNLLLIAQYDNLINDYSKAFFDILRSQARSNT